MPSAAEICEGKSERIGWLIAEIFELFVIKDMRTARRSTPMMKWYSMVLSHYGIRLNERTCSPPFKGKSFQDAMWKSFRSGTVLACVLHYFCGNDNGRFPYMDLSRIYFAPKSAKEFHDNVAIVFEVLLRLRMPLLWTVDNFIAFPNEDFLLWQLHALYLMFRDQRCALDVREVDDLQSGRSHVGDSNQQYILVETKTGLAEVQNIVFRDTVGVTNDGMVDDELVGRNTDGNQLRGIMPGGGLKPRSTRGGTRYSAEDGTLMNEVDWNQSSLAPNSDYSSRRISNFGMDVSNMSNEMWRIEMERKKEADMLERQNQQNQQDKKNHHPHRLAPRSPQNIHDGDINMAMNDTPMYIGGMSSPAELKMMGDEGKTPPFKGISSKLGQVEQMAIPEIGSANGPGTPSWNKKYGVIQMTTDEINDKILDLSTERRLLEDIAEKLNAAEETNEQEMLAACRLTETRKFFWKFQGYFCIF
jgi:hypothetical protein